MLKRENQQRKKLLKRENQQRKEKEKDKLVIVVIKMFAKGMEGVNSRNLCFGLILDWLFLKI